LEIFAFAVANQEQMQAGKQVYAYEVPTCVATRPGMGGLDFFSRPRPRPRPRPESRDQGFYRDRDRAKKSHMFNFF